MDLRQEHSFLAPVLNAPVNHNNVICNVNGVLSIFHDTLEQFLVHPGLNILLVLEQILSKFILSIYLVVIAKSAKSLDT